MRKKCIQCILRERIKVEQERKKAHSIVINGRNADREKWQNESMTSNWVKHNIYLYWLIYSKKTKEKKLICLINWWYFCLSDFSVAFESNNPNQVGKLQNNRYRWRYFQMSKMRLAKHITKQTCIWFQARFFKHHFQFIGSALSLVYHLKDFLCACDSFFVIFFFLANRRNSGSDQNHTISREKPPE